MIFDQKLSFMPHLEYVKKKTKRLTASIAKFSGNTWGLSPKQLREIYIRGIERMITYGSPVWTTKTGKSIQERKLKSIQRIPLLKISKAFRTVSNQVLNIVTNIIPIAQTIEKENELFQILNYDKQFSWQNKQYKKRRNYS